MIPFANYMFWRYMQQTAGIGISQLVFAFGNWTDGYLGYSIDELNAFQSAGQTCFYVALCMFQLGNVFVVRNRRVSSWMSNPFKGPRWVVSLSSVFLIRVPAKLIDFLTST